MMQDTSGYSRFGESVLAGLVPTQPTTVAECMRRAQFCSHFAKLVAGPTRRKLYRLKDANILAAGQLDEAGLVVEVDHDVYVGLLSVWSRSCPSVRLHTHENWLSAA